MLVLREFNTLHLPTELPDSATNPTMAVEGDPCGLYTSSTGYVMIDSQVHLQAFVYLVKMPFCPFKNALLHPLTKCPYSKCPF